MTASDFASFTQNGALCDEEGQLGPVEFERVMRYHIRQLAQSKLASPDDEDFAQCNALKVRIQCVDSIRPIKYMIPIT